MCSLYLRLAAEESFVVLPGTLWWHFALRRLPDHAAAYCEAPPFRWWFASNKQLRNEHRRDHPKRCSHLWGGFWWKWSLAIHEKLHWRPHWSLGMVCCCIFLSDGILNDRWHFDVMRWQRGWSRKSGCKCGGVLVLDSWLLLAASLNLEGKIIHRSKPWGFAVLCWSTPLPCFGTAAHCKDPNREFCPKRWLFLDPCQQQSAWVVHGL